MIHGNTVEASTETHLSQAGTMAESCMGAAINTVERYRGRLEALGIKPDAILGAGCVLTAAIDSRAAMTRLGPQGMSSNAIREGIDGTAEAIKDSGHGIRAACGSIITAAGGTLPDKTDA